MKPRPLLIVILTLLIFTLVPLWAAFGFLKQEEGEGGHAGHGGGGTANTEVFVEQTKEWMASHQSPKGCVDPTLGTSMDMDMPKKSGKDEDAKSMDMDEEEHEKMDEGKDEHSDDEDEHSENLDGAYMRTADTAGGQVAMKTASAGHDEDDEGSDKAKDDMDMDKKSGKDDDAKSMDMDEEEHEKMDMGKDEQGEDEDEHSEDEGEDEHGEGEDESGGMDMPKVYLQVFQFGYLPAWLCLETGVMYEFNMMATDVMHGASIGTASGSKIIRLPAKMEVKKMIQFDKPGEYFIYCSTYCGAGHQFMKGKITVENGSNKNKM